LWCASGHERRTQRRGAEYGHPNHCGHYRYNKYQRIVHEGHGDESDQFERSNCGPSTVANDMKVRAALLTAEYASQAKSACHARTAYRALAARFKGSSHLMALMANLSCCRSSRPSLRMQCQHPVLAPG